jgi:hypothetical protein
MAPEWILGLLSPQAGDSVPVRRSAEALASGKRVQGAIQP